MEAITLEPWVMVFRTSLAPLLSERALVALRDGLANDDARLIQGMTLTPCDGIASQYNWSVDGACLIGYAGWKGDGVDRVAELHEFFFTMCQQIDARIGEPTGVRHLTTWWDATPRAEAVPLLLAEVERSLAERAQA